MTCAAGRRSRWLLGAAALAVITLLGSGLTVRADERTDEEDRLRAIQDDAMVGTVGGTAGFLLKQVGGPVLLADDETYVHDPASAIKVLAHLHAARQAAAGRENAFDSMVAYRYPSSSGGDPSSPNLCPNPADETPTNREVVAISAGLARMMQASDNRMTRAAVLRYGLDPLNGLARELKMGDTRWDQDLVGCGYQDGKRNALTSVDIARLYESVSLGQAISGDARTRFWSLMTAQPVRRGDHLLEIIQEEARAIGKPAAAGPVAERLVRRWKGGAYNICRAVCVVQELIREMDGLASIPFRVDGRVVMRDFAFSSYVADATAVCAAAPCAAALELEASMFLTADELLRTVIRDAIKTF